ncbi:MAG: nitrite reductase [Deltaproteobacteria bacterium]|nr:nitrite reductase [Deltaproteobacteria bacterium]
MTSSSDTTTIVREGSLKKSITILLPAGLVPLELLSLVNDLAHTYSLGIYLSTAQNIRLLDVRDEDEQEIKDALARAGAVLKGPGKFPIPRTCVGSSYCKLGLVDTADFTGKIMDRFKGRTHTKPKFKIAISACPASCSNPMLTDIGIKATRNGFDVFAGGKGGPKPKVGMRIAKGVGQDMVLQIMEELVNFHDFKTSKKQRFGKLLADPDFPFPEV